MKRGGRSDANGPSGSGAASDHNVHDAVVVDVGEGDAGKGDVVIDGELHAFGDGDLGVRRAEWVLRAYGVVVWGWVGLWLMWCCGGWWVIVMMVDVVWWLMGYCDDG